VAQRRADRVARAGRVASRHAQRAVEALALAPPAPAGAALSPAPVVRAARARALAPVDRGPGDRGPVDRALAAHGDRRRAAPVAAARGRRMLLRPRLCSGASHWERLPVRAPRWPAARSTRRRCRWPPRWLASPGA
jgi:hypothetical protein